jgi:hypothetical protein
LKTVRIAWDNDPENLSFLKMYPDAPASTKLDFIHLHINK